MDELGGARFASDFELCVVHVDRDDAGAVKCRCGDGTEPYAAAAEDRDGVVSGDASASCGVVADGQGLHEAELFEGEVCAVEFFSGNCDTFGEGSVPLYAQSLIGRAGIEPAAE